MDAATAYSSASQLPSGALDTVTIGSRSRPVARSSRAIAPAHKLQACRRTRFFLKLSLHSRQLRVINKYDELEVYLATFKFTFEMAIPPRPIFPPRSDDSFKFTFPPPPKIMLRIKIPIDMVLSMHMSKKLKLA
ncbi:hypothetical protein DL93DRAFT_2084732 [Clavulina sp. PMI_390]|nr:hypothetical protein DL93DRAFT_2084732 [Clavulina sp. PMI_390]